MANRKREVPLTDEEKRARNRKYRHKSNHTKNNISARTHNRAAGAASRHWPPRRAPARAR